jgi:hypothetical protein
MIFMGRLGEIFLGVREPMRPDFGQKLGCYVGRPVGITWRDVAPDDFPGRIIATPAPGG